MEHVFSGAARRGQEDSLQSLVGWIFGVLTSCSKGEFFASKMMLGDFG